jgi:predicted nucleic acid-binding protein
VPVLDASVLVAYLARGEHADAARERILSGKPLWVPHLADAEVGHVLRRAVQLGELTASHARAALAALAEMPLMRAAHRPLLGRAWALRANMSFYDALYVALAERLGVALFTLDARMVGAPGIRATVELISVQAT